MKKTILRISITLTILLLSLTTFTNLSAQSRVVIPGTFQSEVSSNACSDWVPDCSSTEFIYQPSTGIWENGFTIPAGCWEYKVALNGTWDENYGANGVAGGANILLVIPEDVFITFKYDPVTHIVSTTPYSSVALGAIKVSLLGSLQSESGCTDDNDSNCDEPALTQNLLTGKWEGKFTLPAGCYNYQVKETSGCQGSVSYFGENGVLFGNFIPLYVTSESEITFSYDAETHIMSTSPDNTSAKVISLYGTLQSELGCEKDYDTCDNSLLTYNDISGKWEGTFTLPPGCYSYFVKESVACTDFYYGEGGLGVYQIQLYIPTESEVSFSFDPETHLTTSSPYSGAPQVLNKITLLGDLQSELGCAFDFDNACDNALLTLNSGTGNWEGKFTLPAGCYQYQVRETFGCSSDIIYGVDGVLNGSNIKLYVAVAGEISVVYNPQTHIISATPDADPSQIITNVSLLGDMQSELGCSYDFNYTCDIPALIYNTNTGYWEGKFTLPAGCYRYLVAQTTGCDISSKTFYGKDGIVWGDNNLLYLTSQSEVSFSYDPNSHIVSATPNIPYPAKVSLLGSLQSETGCANDNDFYCDNPALVFNAVSGKWEGKFNLPAGCYQYQVKETNNCFYPTVYGENGYPNGTSIQLYIPTDEEITFSYDPQTHIVTSTPFTPMPQTVSKVSLRGSLQSELGCPFDSATDCDLPAFTLNTESGKWEGKFTLPAGCYQYEVKETIGCFNIAYYGANGLQFDSPVPLYVPAESEISFTYDPQTHFISSTPYIGGGQTVTNVSLYGSLQSELGGFYDYDPNNNVPALTFNSTSGNWEGKFTLPAGCYQYLAKESIGCYEFFFYDQNGNSSGNFIQLYIPAETEITFTYNPETHVITTTPYYVYQPVISLYGSLQSEMGCTFDFDISCNNAALNFNAVSGKWEGKFTLPAGCYQYYMKESDCFSYLLYGENGSQFEDYIQLYLPAVSEITFSYDPQTHITTTTPNYVYQPVISLYGSLQSELGCASDFDYYCDNPALTFNAASGKWEGKFTLAAGCYQYYVKETINCYRQPSLYGENGIPSGNYIQLYIPAESEISFTYDLQTHIISFTPSGGNNQEVTHVSLYGSLQSELGGFSDFDTSSNIPALTLNAASGKWEGIFNLPAGCYSYQVKETIGCFSSIYYGNNNPEAFIQLYVPFQSDITFSYDPQTHIMSTTPDYVPVPVVSLYGTMQTESGCLNDFDYNCDNPALSFNAVSGKWEGKFIMPQGCSQYYVKESNGCNVIFYGNNGNQFGDYNLLYTPSESEIDFSYDPQTHVITTSPYSGVPITNVSLVGDMQSSLGCLSNWDYINCNSPSLDFNQATGLWEGTFYLDAGCYKYIVKKTDGCFNTTAIGKNGFYGDQTFNYLEMYLATAANVVIKFDPVTNLVTGNFEDICLPATVVIPGSFQSELGCQPNSYNGDWEPACDATRLVYDPVSKLFIGTFNIGAGSWEYKIAYNNSWEENYGLDGIHYGANIPLELCEPSTVTFKYNYKTHLVALEFNPTAICVTKFYDANLNGINDDSIPVAGIQFKLWGKRNSVQYKYTGTDGRVSFSGLAAGNYTVSEKLPPNWVATTSEVQSVALNAPATLSFGNVCLGSGGGHNKFYWISWKGEATLNDDNTITPELSMLSALNLRNKDGSDFDPADYKELKKWLLRDAHSRNRIYGLSVQLAVLQLNVEAGFVDGSAIVYAAGCGSQGYANGFITVNELISKANLALADYGHRHGKDGKRSNLKCLDNAIENANNDQGFVQPQPCTLCNTPVSSRPVIDENIKEVPGKVTIWPNPSNSYFTLRPATAVSNEKVMLRVFDAAGKLVYTDNGNANKNYHFGDAFKPGLYFVELLQGNNRETFKLVKL